MAASAFFLSPCEVRGAQLAADSLTLSPGSSGIVEVSYSSLADQVSGLQFDIEFDNSALNVIAIPGIAVRSAGKDFYFADLGAGWRRILFVGLNQNSLSDGPVLTLFVNVLPSAGAGAYAISITNALGADPSGNAVSISGASGAIAISGQPGDVGAIQSGGILNAASLLPGPIAAGEAITLIGSGIGPSNTTVSFDSVAAPLLYADLNQINLVVPFEVSGKASTVLTISNNGQVTPPLTVAVAPAAPAIFTQGATGVGQAVALNQDGSMNTPLNPASRGSIVTVYLTGSGQPNPATRRRPLSFTATIDGFPAEILSSEPAPGLLAGVSQVNLRVPNSAGASLTAPVYIRVGNAVTQDGVALSLR